MKRTAVLLLFVLMAIILFGCLSEKEEVEGEEVMSETEGEEMEGLFVEGVIAKVELSEVKGIDPIVYEKADELEIFRDLFSSAKKESGIVNVGDPEYYIKVIMETGEKHYLNLWLGGEGETATLMNIKDTHVIQTIAPAVKGRLTELINR